MDYIEIKRTLDALRDAVVLAEFADAEGDMPKMHDKAVVDINLEYKQLRKLLGY